MKLTKILLNQGVIEESMMSQGELIPIYWKETLLNKDISVFSEGCVRRSSYSALIMTYFLVVWSLPLSTITKYLPFTRPLYTSFLLLNQFISIHINFLIFYFNSGLNHRPQLNWVQSHTNTTMYKWKIWILIYKLMVCIIGRNPILFV